ncbi:MAG: chorismate synthase [Sporomusaceae bacterium]|jgi:chorismate synthase|nr:chorismate synthase [Sporomusaceae bacterium]
MFKFITTGESHGKSLTAVVEGLPAGLQIEENLINQDLSRRQMGYGRGTRMQIEKDTVEITSGLRFGRTLGSPVTLVIANRDWPNWQEKMAPFGADTAPKLTNPRPGHADLSGLLKYGHNDVRNILERASARETAARVAAGSLAKQLLKIADIKIFSHVVNIGGISASVPVAADFPAKEAEFTARRDASEVACVDAEAAAKMKTAIDQAKKAGDSLGGVIEIIAANVMPGLGSHVQWDGRLDAKLAAALMSIQAIKGVEIGAGFHYAALPGSLAHDEIFYSSGYYRQTNQAGGIEGGMTNGANIVARAVMKPIPTLLKPLASVDISSKKPVQANTERSDVCAVPAAAVVGEAMLAIVLAGAFLRKFGSDNIEDLKDALAHYLKRIDFCGN